ncbi:MAG: hypothetical protein ACP5J6_02185 [Candidatus Saccharicenans sp.]
MKSTNNRMAILLVVALAFFIFWPAGLNAQKKITRPLRAGEESAGPWWMRITALSVDGRMASWKTKKWWKKALALRPGESFLVEEKGEAHNRLLVKSEVYQQDNGEQASALVLVIDDNGDGSVLSGGDFRDDCYLYDLNRDGLVEVMVDYADENNNGQADYMEIRIFDRGHLVRGWFGYDLDGLGEIFKFKNPLDLFYEKFTQNLSGHKLYFKNVFNPISGTWAPADICPLATFDLNQDGLSDLVIRANLQPASSMSKPNFYFEPINFWSKEQQPIVIRSLEISFDADRGNSLERPFNYDLGLILEGKQAFDYENFKMSSSMRRPPQEVYTIPRDKLLEMIKTYKSTTAGLSWKEFSDESLPTSPAREELEGQGLGWVFERRPLLSTSPNIQKWNVRREVVDNLNGPVELYYSELDQNIHLFGAREGWLPIGHLAGWPRVGEIRYFDTDGDGFFDRREVYLANSSRPVLILTAQQEKAKKITTDLKELSDFYLKEVLPQAIERDQKLIEAMKEVYAYEPPAEVKQSLENVSLSQKRYLLDVYSLLYYLSLRDYYLTLSNQALFKEGTEKEDKSYYGDLYPGQLKNPRSVATTLKSDQAWELSRLLTQMDMAFGQADVEKIIGLLKKIKDLRL